MRRLMRRARPDTATVSSRPLVPASGNGSDFAVTDRDFQRVCGWLREQCGMDYRANKRDLLEHRMRRICEQAHLGSMHELAERLERGSDPALSLAVLHGASTNHTYFYREPQVLDAFARLVLPSLPRGELRIWSAAASSGDEAYTLAMIAAEVLGPEIARASLSILGTDISAVMIEAAEQAVYPQARLSGLPRGLRERYLRDLGDGQLRVVAPLREMCTFRRLNLKVRPLPFQRSFHVVFCRNVLYYFDREQQRATVEAIYEVTEPGGWLLTSVTEPLRDLGTRWIAIQGGVYRKAA